MRYSPAILVPMHKELTKFIIVGSLTSLIDLTTYGFLVKADMHPSASKFFSFLAGTCFAYYANKYFTFKKGSQSKKDAFKFVGLYGFSLAINVAMNFMTLKVLGEDFIFTAFLTATATSTVINFCGQKFWVFKN
ncbi:GtrA family protein, partial [bacterium]|nr:GtrA family protein [bacterium]